MTPWAGLGPMTLVIAARTGRRAAENVIDPIEILGTWDGTDIQEID